MSSVAYLNARMHERATLADLGKDILDRCAEAGAEPTAEERMQLEKWGAQVRVLDAEIAQIDTALRADRQFENVLNRRSSDEEQAERRAAEQAEQREVADRPKTLAELITTAPAFTEYRMRGASERIEIDDIFGLEAPPLLEDRAAITNAQLFPPKQRWDGLPGPSITTPLLQAINHERVSTGSFDYLVWPQFTGAALVAEAALKPEVSGLPALTTLSLDTYAGWVQITRQALEDQPRVRSQIETRLRQNLAAVLEAAAAAVIEAATPAQAGGESLAGIREAIGALQADGYTPTGLMLNPVDFGALDLATMHETNYGPTPTSTFWGLKPIPVPGIPIGTSYVGDFTQAVTWFDRGTTDVFISDSHADFFIRNVFVILAEARAAFAVTDLNALVEVGITQPAPVAASASKSKS